MRVCSAEVSNHILHVSPAEILKPPRLSPLTLTQQLQKDNQGGQGGEPTHWVKLKGQLKYQDL